MRRCRPRSSARLVELDLAVVPFSRTPGNYLVPASGFCVGWVFGVALAGRVGFGGVGLAGAAGPGGPSVGTFVSAAAGAAVAPVSLSARSFWISSCFLSWA